MSSEIRRKIEYLNNLYNSGISNIADWYKILPEIQQTKESLEWIKSSIDKSPPEISPLVDENVLDYLDKATEGVELLGSLPNPNSYIFPVIVSSGSALPSVYSYYVKRTTEVFSDNPSVTKWATETLEVGNQIQFNKNKSDLVKYRLRLIRVDLMSLYIESFDLCIKAKSLCDPKPVGAASTLTRLIEQFKGSLIDKCRFGDGTKYKRISDCLAADSKLTKTVVSDGQAFYDSSTKELLPIRKRMQLTCSNRLMEILHNFEDHVIVITDALDPSKLGISF